MLRVLLLLSMWHAPFPWFHRHELAGPHVDHAESLALHVNLFHAEDRDEGAQDFGWHVHLVLPSAMGACDRCGQPGSEDEPADSGHFGCSLRYAVARGDSEGLGATATPAFAASLRCDLPYLTAFAGACGDVSSIIAFADGPQRPGGHFLQTYAGSVALCDLLSVHLC